MAPKAGEGPAVEAKWERGHQAGPQPGPHPPGSQSLPPSVQSSEALWELDLSLLQPLTQLWLWAGTKGHKQVALPSESSQADGQDRVWTQSSKARQKVLSVLRSRRAGKAEGGGQHGHLSKGRVTWVETAGSV